MNISVNSNDMVVLNEGRLELFVYQKYIGTKAGIISGNTINAFGLLPYRWYKKINDTTPAEVGTLNIPTMVEFHPTVLDMDKTVKIYPESEEKKYTVLTFDKDTEMWSRLGIQSLMNVQIFMDNILSGRFDNNIPYDMILPAWIENTKLNNVSLNVPVTTMDMVVAMMCRDKKTGKKFSEVVGKDPNHSMIGYTFVNIREASASSVFGALSFEDQNAMLDTSINMTLLNKEQRISPIEKILKY